MRLVLLGAPGSGKGTQAKKLMGHFSIPEVSTGEILRKAVDDSTPLGNDARSFMEKGELVPDSIVLGLVHARLKQQDCNKGYIIDGFPRNEAQAAALDKMLSAIGAPITAVVSIEVSRDDLIKRMSGRRICKSCGQVYNIHFLPPRKEGTCDSCGGDFFQRNDDKEDTIKKRLDVYEARKASLIEYYGKRGMLKSITGTGPVHEVFRKVCDAVEGA